MKIMKKQQVHKKTRFHYVSLATVLRKQQSYFLSDKSERNTNTDF